MPVLGTMKRIQNLPYAQTKSFFEREFKQIQIKNRKPKLQVCCQMRHSIIDNYILAFDLANYEYHEILFPDYESKVDMLSISPTRALNGTCVYKALRTIALNLGHERI